MIMTEDKARKIATRQRMAETGEPYSVARRAVEDEHASSTDPFDRMAEDTGAAEARTPPQEQAEQARRLAEQARIQAERAEEAAERAEEAAELTQEAAELTQEWGSDEEIERALRRADEARTAAEQARSRADQAERLAEEAEEAADEAENLPGESEDGPPRGHHRPSRPSNPPRPPRPPRPATPPRPPRPPHVRHHGPDGQDDWPQQHPDPAERLQERVDHFIQRLSVARDQADRLISAAERIFTRPSSEPAHSEPPAGEPGTAGTANG
jgi:multidrug efflux pump subunit AcrA (membrane-fusion protein)